jgi:rod shape determining protein RodA
MKDNQPRFRITIDFFLLIPALVLCITGVMYIYSSGINSLGINTSNEYTRQIIWIIFGLLLMVLVSVFKLDFYKEWALPIMIGGALLVIASLLFGKVVNGARSWLGIGELGIQPSEFMKIAYMVLQLRSLNATKQI